MVERDRVRTDVGVLACDTGDHATGATVVVLVRPENVALWSPRDGAPPNIFTGSVIADRFLGSARRFDLAVESGTIRVETRIRDAVEGVTIPPDAIRLLSPANSAQ